MLCQTFSDGLVNINKDNTYQFLRSDRGVWQEGGSFNGCGTITAAASCGNLYVFGEL